MDKVIVSWDCQSILLVCVVDDVFFFAVLCVILLGSNQTRATASDDAHCFRSVSYSFASLLLLSVLGAHITFIAVLAFGVNFFRTHHLHLHLRFWWPSFVKYCLLLFNWETVLFHLKLLIIEVERLRCRLHLGIQLPGQKHVAWPGFLFFLQLLKWATLFHVPQVLLVLVVMRWRGIMLLILLFILSFYQLTRLILRLTRAHLVEGRFEALFLHLS